MIPLDHTIITENLRLRFPTESDVPHVFSASKYKGFNDGMLWDPPENTDSIYASLEKNKPKWLEGKGYSFSIDRKATGEFLGRTSIRPAEREGVWDIGFWTHPKFQGQGIMTEACEAIVRFGFEMLKANSIEACYASWNTASKKVLENNGFQFVRHIEKGFKKNDIWVAENLMSISRTSHSEI